MAQMTLGLISLILDTRADYGLNSLVIDFLLAFFPRVEFGAELKLAMIKTIAISGSSYKRPEQYRTLIRALLSEKDEILQHALCDALVSIADRGSAEIYENGRIDMTTTRRPAHLKYFKESPPFWMDQSLNSVSDFN